jgi:O-antigen/teichoic acid export membrane protein
VYPGNFHFQLALGLVVLQFLLQVFSNAVQDTVRGFERMDVGAYAQVSFPILNLLLVVPTLLLGGRLLGAIGAQAAATGVVFLIVWRALRSVGVGRLGASQGTLKTLLHEGAPFLFVNMALVLQPFIDAVLLSKLAPAETVGWLAVARKLVGQLLLPCNVLVASLYPTLSRLHVEDKDAFRRTVSSALRSTVILAVPIALCCALYPEVGILIFSRDSYGPAETNLVVLSPFLFLMFFSMPLGISIMASGRQRLWASVQFLCVLVSTVLDPLLIPRFQASHGNGGLGVCVASVLSEIIMVIAGAKYAVSGLFDRAFGLSVARTVAAGGAMTAVAVLLRWLTPFVAAPVALIAYFGCLLAVGGVSKHQIASVRDAIARKVRRR